MRAGLALVMIAVVACRSSGAPPARAPTAAPAPAPPTAAAPAAAASAPAPGAEPYDRLFATGHSWRFVATRIDQCCGERATRTTANVDCEVKRTASVGAARVSEVVCSSRGTRPLIEGFYVRTARGLWHLHAMPTPQAIDQLEIERALVPAGLPLDRPRARDACSEPDDPSCDRGPDSLTYELCVTRTRPIGDGEVRVRWCFAGGDLVSAETQQGDDGIKRVEYRRR